MEDILHQLISHYLQGVIYIPGGDRQISIKQYFIIFKDYIYICFYILFKACCIISKKTHIPCYTPSASKGARLCGFVDRMGTNLMPNFSKKTSKDTSQKRVSLNCTPCFLVWVWFLQNLGDIYNKSLEVQKKKDLYSPSSNYHPFHEFSDLFFKHPLFQHPFLTEVSHALEVLKLC